jgi:SAM-dependent methyltransferase
MHESVMEWGRARLSPTLVRGKRILEAGSCNVNGSLRDHTEALEPSSYTGIDVAPGPGVDLVLPAEDSFDHFGQAFDIVLCTEMLEHAAQWQFALTSIKRCLKDHGLLVLTTRGPGFKFHNPPDHWRFTVDLIRTAVADMRVLQCEDDWQVPGVFLMARRLDGVADISSLTAWPAPAAA